MIFIIIKLNVDIFVLEKQNILLQRLNYQLSTEIKSTNLNMEGMCGLYDEISAPSTVINEHIDEIKISSPIISEHLYDHIDEIKMPHPIIIDHLNEIRIESVFTDSPISYVQTNKNITIHVPRGRRNYVE